MFAVREGNRRAGAVAICIALALLVVVPTGAVLASPTGPTSASTPSAPLGGAALPSGLILPRSPWTSSALPHGVPSLEPVSAPLGPARGWGAVPAGSSGGSFPAPLAPPSGGTFGTDSSLGGAAATLRETSLRIGDGTVPSRAAYLPSLKLLSSPLRVPSQAISPTYTVGPAPMGIADFGLGPSGTTYNLTAPDVRGTFTLQNYNATAGPLYEDTGAYYWNGLSPNATVTPWQSGIQLNTVVANVSYPGANNGSFWTQNVVDFSGGQIQFIDNVWNFSSPAVSLEPGTLYSYNGTPVYPLFYYDLGPTVPVAFPMTIQLFNNASTVLGRTAVTFGYRVVEPGHTYSAIYDTVVFNSTPTTTLPLRVPEYRVDGAQLNPGKLLYDAELIVGGPGGGSNAVVNSLNGSMALAYGAGSTWTPARAAYSYGADTGETSIGLAGWWTGSTEHVDQGPSFLNGLWNTTGGVPSGNVTFHVTLSPSFAFAFLGAVTTPAANLSYAPTLPGGILATQVAPGSYQLTVYADGYATTNLALLTPLITTLTLSSSPGTLSSPLYMNGTAEAESLAHAAVGWTSGPIVFSNLRVNVSQVFNHVNDFGFPEFGLLFARGVTSPSLVISNVSQGPDALVLGQPATLYYGDNPSTVLNAPGLGGEITAWDCPNATFSALTLQGYDFTGIPVGGAVALWMSPGAVADDLVSVNSSYGLWASSSPFADVADSRANNSSVVLTLLASPSSTGFNLTATNNSIGVLAEGSDLGDFSNLTATGGTLGYAGLSSNFVSLANLSAKGFSGGALVLNSTRVLVDAETATDGSVGTEAAQSTFVVVNNSRATFLPNDTGQSVGVDLYNSSNVTVTNTSADRARGVQAYLGADIRVEALSAVNGSLGAGLFSTGATTVSSVIASGTATIGVGVQGNHAPVTVHQVTVSEQALGVLSFLASGVVVSDVNVTGPLNFSLPASLGAVYALSEVGSVSRVSALGIAVGVEILGSNGTFLNGVAASQGALGVEADGSGGVHVRYVTASAQSEGVRLNNSSFARVAFTNASLTSFGVELENSSRVWVDASRADAGSLGVFGNNTSYVSVNGTEASNGSFGVAFSDSLSPWVNATVVSNLTVGVALLGVRDGSIEGLVATGPGASSPWAPGSPWLIPTAAVVTDLTYQSTVGGVRATGYPAGLLDFSSSNLVVDGLNASAGDFGVMLNGSFAAHLVGVGAYADTLGLQMNAGATFNVVTRSSFVNDTGYGVDIESGSSNLVYDNNFVGDHGATAAYNATHVQAFSSSATNAFNDSNGVGNYWADWHTYAGGVLAPYFVGSGAWDYHPLGAPEGQYLVTFSVSGLTAGVVWSATLDGSTVSTSAGSISFAELPGNYTFSVSAGAAWLASPSSGTVAVSSGPVSVPVNFSRLYTVTFTESGLASSTAWTVYLNGVGATGTSASLSVEVAAGSYPFTVVAPSGYRAAPASGSVNVSGDYTVPVAFSPGPPTSTTVTVQETGLPSGTSWTILFGGVPHSTSSGSQSFVVTPGNYSFQFAPVANFTASPASGSATALSATYLLVVAFTAVTYPVTFGETGLPAGTVWSVTVAGVQHTTSASSLTVDLPNGSFDYSFASVSGFSVAAPDGSGLVAGDPLSVSAAYSARAQPSFVTSPTFLTDLGVALGIAVAALLVALYALFRRPRTPAPPRPVQPAAPPARTPGSAPEPPAAPPPWSES